MQVNFVLPARKNTSLTQRQRLAREDDFYRNAPGGNWQRIRGLALKITKLNPFSSRKVISWFAGRHFERECLSPVDELRGR